MDLTKTVVLVRRDSRRLDHKVIKCRLENEKILRTIPFYERIRRCERFAIPASSAHKMKLGAVRCSDKFRVNSAHSGKMTVEGQAEREVKRERERERRQRRRVEG